ncbi:hypothetical protein [Neobacillus sp. NPDC093127]|uniref:hypothetical protein n=1 Tax=Neobacillus sp. NPDC093127 TaxID=3364296 RepID=UPI00382B6003
MEKNQIDRMEEMLAGLISMAGNMNQKLQSMDQEQQTMRQEMQTMRQEMQSFAQEQHSMKTDITDIKNILADMQADQDHIWEKAAKNERELAKFKRHLQL